MKKFEVQNQAYNFEIASEASTKCSELSEKTSVYNFEVPRLVIRTALSQEGMGKSYALLSERPLLREELSL
jgi:hypothetical protein